MFHRQLKLEDRIICIGEGYGLHWPFLVLRCLGLRAVAQVTGTKRQGRVKGTDPSLGLKTCPSFQSICGSALEDFFCFVRSSIAEFLHLKIQVV